MATEKKKVGSSGGLFLVITSVYLQNCFFLSSRIFSLFDNCGGFLGHNFVLNENPTSSQLGSFQDSGLVISLFHFCQRQGSGLPIVQRDKENFLA